jgi:hypothetical protein
MRRSGPRHTRAHVHSPEPLSAPASSLRQLALTAKSEVAIGGSPNQDIWMCTRLANVVAMEFSIRPALIGDDPQARTVRDAVAARAQRTTSPIIRVFGYPAMSHRRMLLYATSRQTVK